MKKNPWLAAGLVLLVLIVVIAVSVKLLLPGLLKKKILDEVKEDCADCVLYLKSVDISLSRPGLLTFHDVKFAAGQGGRSLVEARFTALAVDLSLLQSSRESLVINSVEGIGTEVIYSDGDAKETEEPERVSGRSMTFTVLSTKITGALVRYAHTENKRTSILHIRNIDASLSAFGTTPEIKDKMATARLTGQIEKSGRGELVLAALLRPGPSYVDVLLKVENQNMGDLNSFFTPDDGLKLGGQMIKAVASVNVRGYKSKSHVEAEYKDAEFHEGPTKNRSSFDAFLSNLGASLIMTRTNIDQMASDRVAEIDVERGADEALVHFILRSMKLGLLDVVKKPESRKKK